MLHKIAILIDMQINRIYLFIFWGGIKIRLKQNSLFGQCFKNTKKKFQNKTKIRVQGFHSWLKLQPDCWKSLNQKKG